MPPIEVEVEEARQESLARYGLSTHAEEVHDPDLEMIAQLAAQLTGASSAAVNIIDAARQVRIAGAGGASDPETLPRDHGFCSTAMWHPGDDGIYEMTSVADDRYFSEHPAVQGDDAAVKYYASAPLVGREGLPLGALCVWGGEQHAELPPETRAALVNLANFVTRILDLRRRAAEMEKDALHDPLTGLPNRRLLDDRLKVALARRDRAAGEPLLGLVDLEHFKSINDVHGHQAGDHALIEAARRLRNAVRMEDTVARIGGDEFVFLCEKIRPGMEQSVVERIRATMTGAFVLPDGRTVHLAAGIGIARAQIGDDPASLLERADREMYAARAARRG